MKSYLVYILLLNLGWFLYKYVVGDSATKQLCDSSTDIYSNIYYSKYQFISAYPDKIYSKFSLFIFTYGSPFSS